MPNRAPGAGTSLLAPENFVIPRGPGHGRTLGDVVRNEPLLADLARTQWDANGWTYGSLFRRSARKLAARAVHREGPVS